MDGRTVLVLAKVGDVIPWIGSGSRLASLKGGFIAWRAFVEWRRAWARWRFEYLEWVRVYGREYEDYCRGHGITLHDWDSIREEGPWYTARARR